MIYFNSTFAHDLLTDLSTAVKTEYPENGRTYTALKEQLRELRVIVNRLETASACERAGDIHKCVKDLLLVIAQTYHRFQLTVPIHWDVGHSELTGNVLTPVLRIERCMTALEVLSGVHLMELYLAIEALLREMAWSTFEMAAQRNYDLKVDFQPLMDQLKN